MPLRGSSGSRWLKRVKERLLFAISRSRTQLGLKSEPEPDTFQDALREQEAKEVFERVFHVPVAHDIKIQLAPLATRAYYSPEANRYYEYGVRGAISQERYERLTGEWREEVLRELIKHSYPTLNTIKREEILEDIKEIREDEDKDWESKNEDIRRKLSP